MLRVEIPEGRLDSGFREIAAGQAAYPPGCGPAGIEGPSDNGRNELVPKLAPAALGSIGRVKRARHRRRFAITYGFARLETNNDRVLLRDGAGADPEGLNQGHANVRNFRFFDQHA